VVAVDHDRFQRLERHLAVASVGRLELDRAADEMRTGCILESLRGPQLPAARRRTRREMDAIRVRKRAFHPPGRRASGQDGSDEDERA
jgi:hypothetical protein